MNFKHKKQLSKNIYNNKNRNDFYNKDDPVLITKKFGTHVKVQVINLVDYLKLCI